MYNVLSGTLSLDTTITLWLCVNVVSYKALDGISEQIYTLVNLRDKGEPIGFSGQTSRSQQDQVWSEIYLCAHFVTIVY